MSVPLTAQEQQLARLHAHMTRTIERMLRQHYLAQQDKSLAWGSGMTAAIEIIQRMAVALESSAPPDLTETQAQNMEWQKIVGLIMEKFRQTEIILERDWLKTFEDLPARDLKVLVADERPDGVHLLLLRAPEAQAYADLRNQEQF
jgi:hypothetical protein